MQGLMLRLLLENSRRLTNLSMEVKWICMETGHTKEWLNIFIPQIIF